MTDKRTLDEFFRADDAARPYLGGHGHPYEPPRSSVRGRTDIAVLTCLWGLPFNNLAMAYIHALQPTAIRASFGEVTCDGWPGRVTVMLNADRTIERIEQEVEVAYGSGCELNQALRRAAKQTWGKMFDEAWKMAQRLLGEEDD